MKGGKHGLAFGLAAALLLVGGPGGGISRRGSNGVVLAEARRRRRPAAPPPDTGPVGIQQEIEQKSTGTGEKYNYNQALYLSNLFYEAQRAGMCVRAPLLPSFTPSPSPSFFLTKFVETHAH
jgi:hypothetical protein